jgi:signal transduction histidine kinase
MVSCDLFRIEQVILNLITNAMKYGQGNPIDISLHRFDETAVIEVKDQGIGIAPEAQKKIFEQFERAVKPADFSGLGLGLFISRQIVAAHQGQLTVESESGKGSIFRVLLPIHH